ncbi:molybdate ABC transporter substrate-binding protein [Kitasatospora sp. CB02891]|uniref:molybdate ABC transporter substrate-binding protein n=1 Tax=Kitasatospora sp. CB02891 TaxID=2020329 RepID=UPI000C2700CC|nr:molybdate ABC transporter substrate-binding protein [Kitasatospora sp. CB02891]PJN23845.1 molybdate ABC transporter substrate-binding protein [Kitasatospora sp. CB02891]
MRSARSLLAATAVLALAAALTACTANNPPSNNGAPKVDGTVTVFAAASLKESFTELGKRFEAAYPGAKVSFNFGGSSALAQSIVSGAPVDVFAAASPATMKTVTDAKLTGEDPRVFVRNTLEIAVAKGNPKHIGGLKDLGGVKTALCAKEVPCGAAAVTALKAAGVEVTPATYEQDVKGALTKVELGEVDASLVYRTDVKADAAKIDGVEFPESAQAVNDYPVVSLGKAPNANGAAAFLGYLNSMDARRVLTEAGFQVP